jgi:4-hydroxy-tetrahydrodipicolinate synthase
MSAIGRHVSKFTGYAPALPTPFGAEGDIDIPAFERFCDLQLAHGATALIVCGTTGDQSCSAETSSSATRSHVVGRSLTAGRIE